VGSPPARRDLQGETPVAHGIVVADHAGLLDGEDVSMDAGAIGDESALRLLGRQREAGVVVRQVDLADEPVGGLDGGDAGRREIPSCTSGPGGCRRHARRVHDCPVGLGGGMLASDDPDLIAQARFLSRLPAERPWYRTSAR
jgi:hypothetical protein